MRKQGICTMGLLLALGAVISLGAADADTALIDAVRAGDRAAIRALVRKAGAVGVTEPDGTTALMWAARANDLEGAQLLVRAGASAKTANRYGETALGLAATNGNAAMIDLLLKAGADVNAANPDGQTALMTAARAGAAAAVKVLLSHGATIEQAEGLWGQNALMWAAAEDHGDAVQVLAEAGANINAQSKLMKYPPLKFTPGGMVTAYMPVGGMTPLMYAARNGAKDAVLALLDKGADLRIADGDGTTATIFAIINGHFDVAEQLVERSTPGDLDVRDRAGMTALYAAVDMHSLDDDAGRPLPKARGNNVRLVKRILEKGANPNLPLTGPTVGRHHALNGDGAPGRTALIRASRKGDTELMELLLAHGADMALKEKDGTTVIITAAAARRTGGLAGGRVPRELWKNVEAIRLMVDRGADINAQNERGETALHQAVLGGHDEVVQGLLAMGARLDIQSTQGLNPLDAALAVGTDRRNGPQTAGVNPSTLALLRAWGAQETPVAERRVGRDR